MLIRCKLTGQGTRQAPYDVPLPTKALAAVDYIDLYAVCDVPDSDIPGAVSALDSSHYTQFANGMRALTNCPSGALASWHALLDQRYPSQAGKFRPQVG